MLPMLPIYISYFAGQSNKEDHKSSKMIFKVIAFVMGFTVVFTESCSLNIRQPLIS